MFLPPVQKHTPKLFPDFPQVTPGLGVLCVVLILFVSVEPPRGMSEGHDVHLSNTAVKTDLKELAYK